MRRFLFLAVLLLAALPASAQRIVNSRAEVAEVDSSHVARYHLASTYLRGGQYERAIALLEDLYAESPETYVFFEGLKEAYENIKRYDDAVALVERRIAEHPPADATGLHAEKARLVYLNGDEAGALALWQQTLEDAPRTETAYRTIYSAMLEVRLLEQAIEVLEAGRRRLGQHNLYQADLAYLYALTGRHEEAMDEYLGLLAVSERQLSYVRSRLARTLEQEGALPASIAAAERGVRRQPLNRAYRELLAWLYIEAERFDDAFDAYRAIDRLEKEDGRVLFDFAQRAADAAAYDVALRAYEEILDRYAGAPTAPEARLGLAEMHERWAEKTRERIYDDRGTRLPAPHYDAALAAYRAFLQQHPNHVSYPEVLRRIGRLQQDVFFELDQAGATLAEVAERYPHTQAAYQARFDLGRIALTRGDLDDALLLFTRLIDELRIGELAELARYEQALIHFYRGEFDAAQTLASVLDENTSTDVANDAIELKVLLLENRGPDSLDAALRGFAEAGLLHRQRRAEAAVDRLDALLDAFAQHPIADDARFLRARALREAGRTEDALAAFGEIPLIHPQSFLADRSLFLAAEIQERDLGLPDDALATYTR
ncbi:MAG: tetratricopeptide repeat protein, partial [Rhodothermales bacterium]|nr:tetratricopeptide repeat protein [Rhodothermales bacterium]